MKYEILQIKEELTRQYGFMSYDFVKNNNGLKLENYNKVYEGEIESNSDFLNVCENLFYIFNQERPADFKGHSLSVSDIVKLDSSYFYCDRFGFKLVEF